MAHQQSATPTGNTRRGARAVKSAFRIVRNILAVLGVLFVYLLYTGYMQYQDREAARHSACSFTRCL
ncbi:hypothetical protein [Paraburkholderia aromaticivorans]|uniref:hypothetical protein n=1 Tax=Paraburkholderia aromaticivorans TaxID=2026199 RepID=UPI0014561557|nr:hypothetical protein [Paraburkholderia aromaticivorans]